MPCAILVHESFFLEARESYLKLVHNFHLAVNKINRTTFSRKGKIVILKRAECHFTRGLPQVGGAFSAMHLLRGVGPTVICSLPQLSVYLVGIILGILVPTSTHTSSLEMKNR